MIRRSHWIGSQFVPGSFEHDKEVVWVRTCLLCLARVQEQNFASHMKSHGFNEFVLSARDEGYDHTAG